MVVAYHPAISHNLESNRMRWTVRERTANHIHTKYYLQKNTMITITTTTSTAKMNKIWLLFYKLLSFSLNICGNNATIMHAELRILLNYITKQTATTISIDEMRCKMVNKI